jgi:uncharacterized phage protein gp47/JayE
MAIRTQDEIIVDIITNILREQPKTDVMPGQVLRDVIINAPSNEMQNIYSQIQAISLAQSVSNANFMSENDLNNLLANYSIVRKGATQSIGTVIFYTTDKPTQTVKIPKDTSLGTSIADIGKEITFSTRYNINFDPSNAVLYWNPNTYQYEIPVDIISDNGGSASNVGPFTIVNIRNTNLPFSVTNPNSTAGGVDREDNQTFAIRALNIMLGSNAGTETGYAGLALAQDNILDVLIVKPGDTLMLRDNGFGGKVDIWEISQDVAITNLTKRNNPDLFIQNWNIGDQYNLGYRYDFPQLPVNPASNITLTASTGPSGSLTDVRLYEYNQPGNPALVPYLNPDPSAAGYHYKVHLADDMDTGHSIYSNDWIEWNPGELDYLRQFNSGVVSGSGTPYSGNTLDISISYSYDKGTSDLQSVLDSPGQKILTADVLAKQAIDILIDVYMEIQLNADVSSTPQTTEITRQNVITALSASINNKTLGSVLQESDLVQVAHNVTGVDNVVLSSIKITRSRPVFYNANTEPIIDDNALENQYFSSNNITVVVV